MGQRPEAVDVADRPQTFRTQMRVDRNAASIRFDTDGLEADPLHARTAARGDEQAVAT